MMLKNYWKVAAGSSSKYWENFIGDGFIGYYLRYIKDCRNYQNDDIILDITKNKNEAKFGRDLILFFRQFNIGDKVVLYGKQSIIALGEIEGDYEYNPNYPFNHVRKVNWTNVYGLNLFKKQLLTHQLSQKLKTITTFVKLTQDDWEEIQTKKIEHQNFPLSKENDIHLYIASNIDMINNELKFYAHEYPVYSKKTKSWNRIDILAYDKGGDLVVIEVKKDQANLTTLKQISEYIDFIKIDFEVFEEVKGIIVAYDFTEELKEKIKEQSNISLKTYKVGMSFQNHC